MIRVFLADDESPARERLKELLQDIAAEVPTAVAGEARNGVEALERLPASGAQVLLLDIRIDRKSTRLNSSHQIISYAVFSPNKKTTKTPTTTTPPSINT